jgi:hypothetical protein
MDSCTVTTAPLLSNRTGHEPGLTTGVFLARMVRPSNEETRHWNGMRMANVTGPAVRQLSERTDRSSGGSRASNSDDAQIFFETTDPQPWVAERSMHLRRAKLLKAHIVWHVHHFDLVAGASHRDEDGHVINLDEDEDLKVIGVYSSEPLAGEAIERARLLEGFRG